MDRREALKLLSLAAGTPSFLNWSSDDLVAGLRAHGAHLESAGPHRFQTLNPHQRATVAELSDLILPTTETPGARAAKVDEFIDTILTDWVTESERTSFLAGLADVDAKAKDKFGKTFLQASSGQRGEQLTQMDSEVADLRKTKAAWKEGSGPKPADPHEHFFHRIRSLTVSGYYSSEVGMTLERKVEIIPGRFQGCVPVKVL